MSASASKHSLVRPYHKQVSTRTNRAVVFRCLHLSRRRLSVFGHIARLDAAIPAMVHYDWRLTRGKAEDPIRLHGVLAHAGRPRRAWVDHIRDDAGIPLPTLWSTEVARGHEAARRSPTTGDDDDDECK